MARTFDGRILGVLGGMGPMAGAMFLQRLTILTGAERDQDHIPAILWSDPRVPDRSSARLGAGEDPLPWLLNGIRGLESCGAQALAIPCNTAHLWYGEMAAATPLPILHIADAVIADLRTRVEAGSRVGLMGTAATLRCGLYQERLACAGYEPVVPSDDEIERFCARSIGLVKANRIKEAFEPAAGCIGRLAARGTHAVVLACTELPVAVPHARRGGFEVELSDSIDALALAAIRWHRAA